MPKQHNLLIIFLALATIFLIGYQGFGWENLLGGKENPKVSRLATWVAHSDSQNSKSDKTRAEAWQTFENYLIYAQGHNLAGIKSLSHQISDTCQDPSKELECFALMDNVYAFASPLKESEFKYIQEDGRQIIIFTDGPEVKLLYFTKVGGAIKLLGLRFCFDDRQSYSEKSCVEINASARDENGNGWWDSVESLFRVEKEESQ